MAFQQEHHRTPLGHNLFMLEVKCQSARVRSISKLETFQQSCGDIPHPLSMLNRLYRLPSWSMIIDKSFFFGEVPLSKIWQRSLPWKTPPSIPIFQSLIQSWYIAGPKFIAGVFQSFDPPVIHSDLVDRILGLIGQGHVQRHLSDRRKLSEPISLTMIRNTLPYCIGIHQADEGNKLGSWP